ncbi:MAG: hypothetical protein BWX88_00072 [Planctomycetes bacterium ADurb.Bin126]|nr:MAG: hypothetical protein BWX88_00072 [Planctomycetes bacterium ADurb.Bin126]HOD81939.1 DUF5060 domain-containing protein [Phycisphaerae bacterium]HQL76501.1 DUF5060 domain-containing protein [Phycisphaerae bacterium]
MSRTARVILAVCLALLARASVATAQEGRDRVRVEPARPTAWQKIELSLPADCIPPAAFDDRKYELAAEVTEPSGRKRTVPGFYCQPCEHRLLGEGRRQSEWIRPAGAARWTVRHLATEAGRHTFTLTLRTPAGTRRLSPVTIDVLPSPTPARGYVRVARDNPRYLEFSDGRVFFPIGQNIAFVGLSQYAASSAGVRSLFAKMSAQGGNYVRMWACCQDWAACIEGVKSAWGRTWGPKPAVEDMPDAPPGRQGRRCLRLEAGKAAHVNPTRPVALRGGAKYRLGGLLRREDAASVVLQLSPGGDRPLDAPAGRWTSFAHEFRADEKQLVLGRLAFVVRGGSAWLTDLSLVELDDNAAPAGPNLLWQADVNRSTIGWYDQEDCSFLDRVVEAAEQTGVYLQVVVVTRDLYMKSLSREDSAEYAEASESIRRLMRYAVARWGYSPHVATWEYFNEMDPGKPTDRLYRELGEYLHRIDGRRRPRATSTWSHRPRDWAHAQLDTADLHHYLRPSTGEAYRDSASTYADRARFLLDRSPGKPALLSEFGLADDKFQRGQAMAKDKDFEHARRALWASATSGLAGSAMYWWWDDFDRADAYRHYRPLADFVADVPFVSAGLAPARVACSDSPAVRAVGIAGKGHACVWLYDPKATWHAQAIENRTPELVRGAWAELPDMPPGEYSVIWWDSVAGKQVARREIRHAAAGPLRLSAPDFRKDIAAKIGPR